MFLIPILFFTFSVLGADCTFPGEPAGLGSYQMAPFAEGFNRPIKVVADPANPSLLYVVEQAGIVKALRKDNHTSVVVLDIRDRVTKLAGPGDERGLLGLALHPQFAETRRLFVNYTTKGTLRSHISEFKMLTNGNIDPKSERLLLEVSQPYDNHNGGEMAFGPDGYLYLGFGDGGSGGDPQGNGQNLKTLLGKILRIDVDHGTPYSVPKDNPFVNRAGAKPEIFAYGLRNPWRFSFDRVSGELYASDVGQNKFEEVDLIKSGGNYGWNITEGLECYANPNCSKDGLIAPIFQYDHGEGISITGGFVYRGKQFPELLGTYLFGDYGSGKIWGIRQVEGKVTESKIISSTPLNISSFGEDLDGEIYIVSLAGQIFTLSPSESRPPTEFPRKLSETGCFKSLSPLTPAGTLVPYEVNSPLWSDGAEKKRFIKLPSGSSIEFSSTQPWNFPVGTVLVKQFSFGEKNIETRFLVKKVTGFQGYSYRWNEEETDAEFLGGSATREMEFQEEGITKKFNYFYPSGSDCLRCHTKAANEVLGFSLKQLNRDSQLRFLADKGILKSVPADTTHLPKLPASSARTYLEVQCAHCHRPDHPIAQGPYDFRFETPFADMHVTNAPMFGNLGIPDAKVVFPGNPEKSLLLKRIESLDPHYRMPPLASNRQDKEAINLIRQWISEL